MPQLIWQLIFHPVRTLKFLYSFSTQLALILAKRILLPYYPTFHTLRLQAHRAYLSAANLHFPDLVHRLPVQASDAKAHRIGKGFTAYVIPGTIPLEDYKVDRESTKRVVVLYAHGGGYARGEARMYMKYMDRWRTKASKRGLDLAFVSVEYPLSTAKAHPAQLNSFLASYRHVLDLGFPPSRIIFMGDSAGGGLSVLGGLALLSLELPQPAASILVSPWMDMACNAYEGGNPLIETDYVVTANQYVPTLCKMFIGSEAPDSPEVNPLYRQPQELDGLNRQLVLVGSGEFCVGDAREWARLLAKAGVEHKIVIEPAQMHIYAVGSDWVSPDVVTKTDGYILDWIQQAIA